MWFSIGVIEVGMIVVALVAAACLFGLKQRSWSWAAAASACLLVAALVTPADPISTVILGSAFFVFFVGGTRFGRTRSIGTA